MQPGCLLLCEKARQPLGNPATKGGGPRRVLRIMDFSTPLLVDNFHLYWWWPHVDSETCHLSPARCGDLAAL